MHIKNFQHQELNIEELKTDPNEIWCIFGENNSGIEVFMNLLSGKKQEFSAKILELPDNPGIISFLAQQELYEEEIRNDDTDFIGTIDPGTLVREFLPDYQRHLPLLQAFGLDYCLDRGYRQLSSGQSRKLLFLEKLTGGATTLILQNPYDGLDPKSCHELNSALQELPEKGIELIFLVNSVSDIPAWCSHLAMIHAGRLEVSGPYAEVLPQLSKKRKTSSLPHPAPIKEESSLSTAPVQKQKEELVFLVDGFAHYGENTLFTGLDLVIHSGDHTLISGPNGCGKSTLLDIITGDNPHCYANNLRIFGRKRGSGESIWDIKKQMGIVSPALHREHRIPGSALHVLLSGLHDSIGLYRKVTTTEKRIGEKWLGWLSLGARSGTAFRKLSFAEQRLVLIGRALIKQPKLLILDEPTQGLDDNNRNKLLDFLEEIAQKEISTILFVSHRTDEQRALFKNQIQLDSYAL